MPIPGHGPDKVNAAYAIGGPALAITTVKRYLGIDINHVVEVNFVNFPQLIDALGGIDLTSPQALRRDQRRRQERRLDAEVLQGRAPPQRQAGARLARMRKDNQCFPGENDFTRAQRQQKILSAIKGQVASPSTFFRLPWVSWEAPKAIRSDMGGPSLLGLFSSLAVGGTPPTRILKGDPSVVNGQDVLVVPEARKQAAVKRFENG